MPSRNIIFKVGQRVQAKKSKEECFLPATITAVDEEIIQVQWRGDNTSSSVSIRDLKRGKGRPVGISDATLQNKHEKFKRIMTARMNKALKVLKTIDTLINNRNYSWTAEEAVYIVKALRQPIDNIEKKLTVTNGITVFKL